MVFLRFPSYILWKILVGNRQSAVILSRDPYVHASSEYKPSTLVSNFYFLNLVEKMFLILSIIKQSRAKLISYNIDIRSFHSIDQNKCRFSQVDDVLNSTIIGLGDIDW